MTAIEKFEVLPNLTFILETYSCKRDPQGDYRPTLWKCNFGYVVKWIDDSTDRVLCLHKGETISDAINNAYEWCERECVDKTHYSPHITINHSEKNEFKPFDKVLVRDSYQDVWLATFYSHTEDGNEVTVNGEYYNHMIPFNEKTSHLLGTTNEY